MLPDLELKLENLIKGQIEYKSANLGLNLLIARMQKKYLADETPIILKICLQEMRAFFEKYSSIMVKDIEALKNL